MIVHHLDVECIPGPPCEADSELIIHPDAVLPFSVTFQRFQPVAWWHSQILQRLRTMKHPQFPERHTM